VHPPQNGAQRQRLTDEVASCALQESPLSAAILIADVNKPGFNGKVTYGWLPSAPKAITAGNAPSDARFGDWVQVTGGNVAVYASGYRNPFGTTVRRDGKVMVTDNGPNGKFGEELLGLNPDGTLKSSGVGAATEDSIHWKGVAKVCAARRCAP
jgi:hypothetical protein